jgi:pyruvate-ferredoxin/flavodoxin oxidoreductase
VAEAVRTPFFVVQDGFLTTHTLENVTLPSDSLLQEYVGDPRERIQPLFDPASALMIGVVQNQDSYMKGRIAQRAYYDALPAALDSAMREWTIRTGRPLAQIDAHRCDDADLIVVAMGTMADTARAVVDALRTRGVRVGAVAITSFRPFPAERLAAALRGAERIAVIERTDDPAAAANPLTREVKSAIHDAAAGSGRGVPVVLSVSAGLGSRDVRAGDIAAVVRWLEDWRPGDRLHRVVGIRHPAALAPEPIDISPPGAFGVRGQSIGGLGSITTNKLLATVMGEVFGKQVQAYPRYGSEKKGLPTSYSLMIADGPIRSHAELEQVEFVPLHDASAFGLGDPIAGLADGGTVFLQSPFTDPGEIWESIPEAARIELEARRIRVTALDTAGLAAAHAPRPDLAVRMQGIALIGVFLRVTPFAAAAGLDRDAVIGAVGARLARFFGKRGSHVLEANLAVIAAAYDGVIDVSSRLGLQSPGEPVHGLSGALQEASA